MNFREWSNPDNWDEQGNWNPQRNDWCSREPGEDSNFDDALRYLLGTTNYAYVFSDRPVYTDEETIDLMMDHLERQFPVEFDEYDKQFLHSVGMSHV